MSRLILHPLILSITTMLYFLHTEAQAQQWSQPDAEQIVQELIDSEDLDPEMAEVMAEYWLERMQNPVNLNRASEQELLDLPGIPLAVARQIVRSRTREGPFRHPDELTTRGVMTADQFEQIRYFITTGSRNERFREHYISRNFWTEGGRFEHFSRTRTVLEQQYGYQRPDSTGGYLGSPHHFYQRTRYTGRRLSLNLNHSKMPGEPVSLQSGFHHSSWHAAIRNAGSVRSFVAGDFNADFGQGLLMRTGSFFGKGLPAGRLGSASGRGVIPASASRRGNTFRGAGFTMGERMELSLFWSDRERAATIHDDGSTGPPQAFPVFRSHNELNRKDSLRETTYGSRVSFPVPGGRVGFQTVGYRFNTSDRIVDSAPQPFETGYSADLYLTGNRIAFFGEMASTGNHGRAVISGISTQSSDIAGLTIIFRSFSPDFSSLYGNPLSEQSGAPAGETGFFTGLRVRPADRIRIEAFADHFQFRTPGFRNSRPVSGSEYRGSVDLRVSRSVNLQLQYRQKGREIEIEQTGELGRTERRIGQETRRSIRVQSEFRPDRTLRLRTRLEKSRYGHSFTESGSGLLMFQDIQASIRPALRLDMRFTLFDTDGYDTRLYQFENDLLYSMTSTMLHDRGQRFYTMLTIQLSRHVTLWTRYATTLYDNRITIGSGNDLIEGNRRSELAFQLRISV